jgi:hypothetical protein
VTRRKTPQEQRRRLYLAVADAYRRHANSTTQKEDAAAELNLDLPAFITALAKTRQAGILDPQE